MTKLFVAPFFLFPPMNTSALRVARNYLSMFLGPAENDPEYDKLEKKLENAYKKGAPQKEIDKIETELSKWVSEEYDTSEEDLLPGGESAVSEGISIDEELRDLYGKYLKNPADKKDLLGTMRSVIESSDYVYTREKAFKTVTDEQILDAAKDVYEHHLHLKRKRSMPRLHPTPEKALERLRKIRERVKG